MEPIGRSYINSQAHVVAAFTANSQTVYLLLKNHPIAAPLLFSKRPLGVTENCDGFAVSLLQLAKK